MAYYVVDTENTNLDAGDNDDNVLVYASGAVVQGGAGKDSLTTSLYLEAAGEDTDGDGELDSGVVDHASTELHGDAGDDYIHAFLRLESPFSTSLWPIFTAALAGGAGSDHLWLDIDSFDWGFDARIDGGGGNDDIRVDARGIGDSYGSGGPVLVDAGDGDDTVNVSTRGRSDSGSEVRVKGGDGNDFITGHSSDITISGAAYGTTVLFGGSGDDTLIGSAASRNTAEGGSGNDRITLDSLYNTALGGAGGDHITATAWLGQAWHGGTESGENSVSGGAGNDTVEGVLEFSFSGAGTNELHGGAGNDRLIATISFDLSPDPSSDEYPLTGEAKSLIYGDGGDDRITVRVTGNVEDGEFSISSELYGGGGDDRLTVRDGEGNILNGGAGNDTLIGGSGSDTLIGLQGNDALEGKGGADIFLFGFIRSGERDRISDFVIGEDVIDLSQIDANRDRAGEQSFRFGTREGTGRAWIEEDPDSTGSILHADDGHRVLEVLLRDGRAVEADDYSASSFLL